MTRVKALAAPYLLWVVLFTVIPCSLVVYFAFTNENGGFTLANFRDVPFYTPVFLKSLYLSLIATVICFLIAYPMGLILMKANLNTQRTVIMLVMLPMWMNFLLRTYAWMTLLENEGLINHFLELFGIGPFRMINTQGAVVLGMVYNYLPFMILPIYSVMVKINPALIEAAQDLGAGSLKVVSKIIFPLSIPGVVSGIIMVFVPSISTFIISRMLGGGSNMLIGDLIEMQFIGSVYNPYVGSAISLILMIVVFICMGIINRFGGEKEGTLL